MKSDMCREKLKGKECTVEVTVGKNGDLVFVVEFHKQLVAFFYLLTLIGTHTYRQFS